MSEQQPYQDLQHIRQMMERSSRFISLSGLSGIGAGICALAGAWLAYPFVTGQKEHLINPDVAIVQALGRDYSIIFNSWLFWIAVGTFLAAVITAFLFTWLKSRRDGTPIWGTTAKRLLINVSIPLAAGGLFLIKAALDGSFELIAPGCLVFYGLALVNASKYTLNEIRFLGYCQLLLGIINLCVDGYGLLLWATGFGILHIVYGAYMWMKYDRKND